MTANGGGPTTDFKEVMTILSLDLFEAFDRFRTDPFHQATRRNWIRTFCSQVDAFAYTTKQFLADMHDFPFVRLTADDMAFLREADQRDDSGIIAKMRRLPLKDNLKHLAATAARAMEFNFTVDTNTERWVAFLGTIKIRDRLVHPKRARDLMVTDDELQMVNTAQDWFHEFSGALWQKMLGALRGTND
jgi:hypothetical protein